MNRLRQVWASLSLASQFGLAMAVVLVAAGAVIGAFLTRAIEDAVVRNSATATAIYLESVIAPISQQLADGDTLSPGAMRALDEIFGNTPLGERVVSYKFWREDGRVILASDKSLEGRVFPLTPNLQTAWDGVVSAEFDELADPEDSAEAALGLPLLEIYSPIREVWSGRIIAVAEFYEVTSELAADLAAARRNSWGLVALTGLVVGLALYAIVLGGSRTIRAQRLALDARLAELAELSDRNRDLRLRVQAAAGRAAAQAEDTMRRIGADLHDGPAQHLAYALLRLDRPGTEPDPQTQGAVATAMAELRAISRGLALPEIRGRPLGAIIRAAAEAHAGRSGHPVAITPGEDPPGDPGDPLRIAVFRFVQEGLNNASRHAGGKDLAVVMDTSDGFLHLRVQDRGPGPPAADIAPQGLGLAGLRDRVEALGGRFAVEARDGGGTEISMIVEPGGRG